MTDVNASVCAGIAEKFASATLDNDRDAYVANASTTLGGNPPIYKNYGVFSGVLEVWISSPFPSNSNPATGHNMPNTWWELIGPT